jgi:hypothetical protein
MNIIQFIGFVVLISSVFLFGYMYRDIDVKKKEMEKDRDAYKRLYIDAEYRYSKLFYQLFDIKYDKEKVYAELKEKFKGLIEEDII